MAFKVSKSVQKALENFRGRTLLLQSREQLASELCQSSNCSGGGIELWLKVVKFIESKGAVTIEDITELEGRKATRVKVVFSVTALRLSREERRMLDGYKKKPAVEDNVRPRYVRRMKVVA
jgi:hypothetical protein